MMEISVRFRDWVLNRVDAGAPADPFSWAAVASTALFWIAAGDPTGERTYSHLVLAAISLLVGGVAVRTAVAIGRHELLPSAPRAPETPAVSPVTSTRPTAALVR